ncbi:hypothetical protein Poli38472_013898 [Pythium oligandrum]|uniref:RING finger and CHY zinc finger domain-containing protein 1 n=1 Tax=Pythium oligandrum TaxID=41045 RepID=A0A8K1C2A2_PYTOL|nr:hypothetical protein Poli38472_013898 [Pythium oligandrum]|eukprot:TMW55136.1 hypothetical protein Poli38472_013898 [Pythium oligandrum]
MADMACAHYRRGCRVLAACCKNWVGCRLCHNELYPDHEIDRHAIQQMQCLACDAVQPCARECVQCKSVMGDYFCKVCNLFDDDGAKKQIFHCEECGICRVGGRENYFHCSKCCGCYPHSLLNKHKCLEGSMHRECAICLEVTFASIESVNVLPCGHVLHSSCWKQLLRHGKITCPMCRTSMITSSDEASHGEESADDNGSDSEAFVEIGAAESGSDLSDIDESDASDATLSGEDDTVDEDASHVHGSPSSSGNDTDNGHE